MALLLHPDKNPNNSNAHSDFQKLLASYQNFRKIPLSSKDLSNLESLVLGYNRFTGKLPKWIEDDFLLLKILSFRSNSFSGEIPSSLVNLNSLQVLDLAENKLSGRIPTSLDKRIAMTQCIVMYLMGFSRVSIMKRM
ncbi:serine-threonine protein kinase, plant-type, putative [Ricinus communis]|uniref:Serine-threonine protein kinase, plant-type, putative n=1 Tax=Ricinus communis TaxID=3988 RepID=B9RX47_RICCO|nr:serine-threonine protein kinase, plant-type, putative [Ricinus communis]